VQVIDKVIAAQDKLMVSLDAEVRNVTLRIFELSQIEMSSADS